jgi:hypothetical protein
VPRVRTRLQAWSAGGYRIRRKGGKLWEIGGFVTVVSRRGGVVSVKEGRSRSELGGAGNENSRNILVRQIVNARCGHLLEDRGGRVRSLKVFKPNGGSHPGVGGIPIGEISHRFSG